MRRAVRNAQNVSKSCFCCGLENPAGLHAQFLETEADEVVVLFTPTREHQSYPGRLHGGVASALLDEAIGRAVSIRDPETWGVTIELSVRYRKPVPLDRPAILIARVDVDRGRIFEGSGEILLEDGSVAVEASGRYLRLPIERIAEGDLHAEWFADPRPAPLYVELPEPSTGGRRA
ncbi:MAG: PaaI family thioesterase [Coriobacteriia bacterium]|nr:PaaI family thioesterase [Coriobacteriia bacterium]